MRGIRSTLALLVIALLLGAYIYFVEADRPPAGTAEPLATVFEMNSDDIDSLSVTSTGGVHTKLQKTDDRWQLVEPFRGNVDVTKVVSLSSSLASLEMQRVVAEPEDAPNLEMFGLSAPRIEVGFTTTTDEDARLQIGERTPTGSDLYATVAASNRIFLISGFLEDTFDQTTFDLRDKSILDIVRNDVDALEISGGDLSIRLEKDDSQWALVRPIAAAADLGTTDGLVGRLSTGQMVAVDAEDTDVLEPYGLNQPRVQVTVGLGSSAATLLVGGTAPDGTVYARDAARGLVFRVEESLVAELGREADAYRRKDLFAFRPFNATALQLTLDGERWRFERTEDDDGTDGWHRTSPDPGDVDQTSMDDLLAKLSNLRAEEFAATREDTGLDTPTATIEVTFDDDAKQERVVVGRRDDTVYAVSGDETGAARLNTRSWDDALEALGPLRSTPDDAP
ncbi:MAG: DUF4340 domain-containing protein [Acidobacteriota bacterium]|nr:DUF4340 domain-containing protein [Acidobacteriota bacterium]